MKSNHDIVTITEVTLEHETDRAWLFHSAFEDKNKQPIKVWVPKSQAEWDGKELQMPEWLAVKAGLV